MDQGACRIHDVRKTDRMSAKASQMTAGWQAGAEDNKERMGNRRESQADMLLDCIDAVLFDIDGTLVDSMGLWKEVDRIYLARYGKDMAPDLQSQLSGLSITQTADYFRDVIGIQETTEKMLADWNALAYEQYHDVVQAKPGALRWVKDLHARGIRMAVGTSNTRTLAETVLQVQGFAPYFQTMLTGEDVVAGKPDPYIYLECARRLGVPASRCLVFEDISAGLIAGRAAGAKTCAVRDLFSMFEDGKKRENADYCITDFEDIYAGQVQVLR